MDKTQIKGYIKPGKVFGPIYFVGTKPASSHLIDTGDGLILLDTGYPDTFGLLSENIEELGFDVKDIKIVLISHAHYDHIGTAKKIREMTGAKIYVGEKDFKMAIGEEDPLSLDLPDKDKYYVTPDVCIADRDVIELGNISILCLSTPGHTDGTMSFFFDVSDNEKTYRAGMFGGAGTNTLTEEFLLKFHLPFDNRNKFLNSIELMKKEKVEIFLGNHVVNNKTDEKLERVANGDKNAFVAPEEWIPFLESRKKRLLDVIAEDKIPH